MAKYKVCLDVRDCYGNIRKVDGGTINVDFNGQLSDEEIKRIEQVMDLDKTYATDVELENAVGNVPVFDYGDFEFTNEASVIPLDEED